jgi:hypothetical protein
MVIKKIQRDYQLLDRNTPVMTDKCGLDVSNPNSDLCREWR